MSEAEKKPIRFLIVDKDERFVKSIKRGYVELRDAAKAKQETPYLPVPVNTETVRETQSYLSNREYDYAAVFINPVLGKPQWLALVKSVHQFRPSTPVYIVYDEKPDIKQQEAEMMGVYGFMAKPIDYQKMLDLVTKEDEAEKAPEPTKTTPAAPQTPPSVNDTDYIPFSIESIYGSTKSMFDLFAKLSTGKYVQVLRAGEYLSMDRIQKYREKGVKDLFIAKSSQEDYLKFCDEMLANMLKDSSVSLEVKSSQVVAQGKAVMGFLQTSQFSEKSIASAQQFVANTTEMVKQIATGSDMVQKILNDVATMEHGVAVSTMASLFMKHLGGAGNLMNAVGMACFFHDADLVDKPQTLKDEDPDKMNEDEKKIFFEHPTNSAKIVRKIKGIPPATETAVLEHHLRMNRKGFPASKQTALPNRLAELIGLCEEFIWLVRKAEIDKNLNPQAVFKERVVLEFSEPMVIAFNKAFDEK